MIVVIPLHNILLLNIIMPLAFSECGVNYNDRIV